MQPLPDLSTLDHAQKNALIVALYAIAGEVEALLERVTELEGQRAKNSNPSVGRGELLEDASGHGGLPRGCP